MEVHEGEGVGEGGGHRDKEYLNMEGGGMEEKKKSESLE